MCMHKLKRPLHVEFQVVHSKIVYVAIFSGTSILLLYCKFLGQLFCMNG